MSWAAPGWALAGLVVAFLAIVVGLTARRHTARLDAALGPVMAARALPSGVRARRGLAATAALLGMALGVIALVEPRFGKELIEFKQEGVDLVLVVDLSTSMAAQDVEPDRLERARREILDLLTLLEGDRIGLVVFAGGAFPRLPLTRDDDIVRMIVGELDVRTIGSQGSALGDAVRLGVELLDDPKSRAGRGLLVLSDGELHNPEDALDAAELAAARDVRIFTMMIGDAPAPIPLPDGSYLRWKGETVVSAPDDSVLRSMAQTTGGAYVHSVAGIEDMAGLYRGAIRANLNAGETSSFTKERWKSAFQLPLGVGLLLLLVGAWLGDGGGAASRRVLGWLRRAGAIAAVILVVSAGLALFYAPPAEAASLAEADRAYRAERWRVAADLFAELAVEQPDNPDVFGRLGAARYRAGDFEGAARAYETQVRLTGGQDPNASYNAGNAAWQAGRLQEALGHYEQALRADPTHGAATQNKAIAEAELAERRKRVPPPPQEGEGGNPESAGQGSGQNEDESKQDGSEAPGSAGGQSEGEAGEGEGEGESSQGGQPGKPGESKGAEGEEPGKQESEGSPELGGEPGHSEGAGEGSGGQDVGGERDERGKGSETVNLDELDELAQREGEGAGGGEGEGGQTAGDAPGDAAQAERLLEGVKEGRPRVIPSRGAGGKPW